MLPVQVFLQLHELQRGTPSRMGSCLTLGNELSEEIHVLTKQKTLLELRAQMENNAKLLFNKASVQAWLICYDSQTLMSSFCLITYYEFYSLMILSLLNCLCVIYGQNGSILDLDIVIFTEVFVMSSCKQVPRIGMPALPEPCTPALPPEPELDSNPSLLCGGRHRQRWRERFIQQKESQEFAHLRWQKPAICAEVISEDVRPRREKLNFRSG
ncbi:uncharacterized protein LOC122694162 [Cervus elaphus]|uniref:uncharacterized protein LOC122452116 n=1 Tax=Cervus canadensis TaxID=1574408 RepID=UPI001C9E2F6C|nr:uncharacterized protein LOC122452116 [Cervus canadensis]XP_043758454.1 uncharacterized protein LOC122694162 [Cervus elaphus]